MLIYSTLLLLTSNAMNNRRDSSIIYSRISIIILINTILLLYIILNINFSYKGLILYNGYIDIKNYLTCFHNIYISNKCYYNKYKFCLSS